MTDRVKVLVSCPHCDKRYRVPVALLGKYTTCAECEGRFALRDEVQTENIQQHDSEYDTRASVHAVGVVSRTTTQVGTISESASPDKDENPLAWQLAQLRQTEGSRRYQIGEEIARGGMGAIIKSRDMTLRRKVAMKIMLSQKKSAKELRRFVEEAQITGQLEHPNIVPVYELGVDAQDQVFYTMKMVNGKTMMDILSALSRGDKEMLAQYPLAELLDIFTRVCDAISFAHSRDVIHRDLKPENIMVGAYGEVLVMDWGLAKVLPPDAENDIDIGQLEALETTVKSGYESALGIKTINSGDVSQRTLEGVVIGTPQFMAPEQARGEISKISAPTDVYSLGAILYEILTLRPPVEGKSVEEMLNKVAAGEIKEPIYYNSSTGEVARVSRRSQNKGEQMRMIQLRHCPGQKIPASLSAVCMRAMENSRADRYQTAQALKKDVQAYLQGFATEAEDPGTLRQVLLLVQRHKSECAVLAAGFLVVVALVFSFVHSLRKGEAAALAAQAMAEDARDDADKERLVAKYTLEELKNTVPIFIGRAEQYIAKHDFEAALNVLHMASNIDVLNEITWAFKGKILQSLSRFEESIVAFEAAADIAGDDRYRDNIRLSWKMSENMAGRERLLSSHIVDLHTAFMAQGRIDEATALLGAMKENSYAAFQTWRLKIEELKAAGRMESYWLRHDPEDGMLILSITRLNGSDLSFVKGMPLKSLNISRHLQIIDIKDLEGLPLEELNISECSVSDLSPLKGMPLKKVYLSKLPITSIYALKNMPIVELDISQTPLTNIDVLADMPLENLNMYQVKVKSIKLLSGKNITKLSLGGSATVANLGPLKGMPLIYLRIGGENVFQFNDLNMLEGMQLEYFYLKNYMGTELDILKGMPLKEAHFYDSPNIRSIEPLCTANLEYLSLVRCTGLEDVQNVAKIQSLKRLIIPTTEDKDLTFLKQLPLLETIGMDYTKALNPDEFFKVHNID